MNLNKQKRKSPPTGQLGSNIHLNLSRGSFLIKTFSFMKRFTPFSHIN